MINKSRAVGGWVCQPGNLSSRLGLWNYVHTVESSDCFRPAGYVKTRFILCSDRVVLVLKTHQDKLTLQEKHLLSLPNKIKHAKTRKTHGRLQMFHRGDLWVSSMFRNRSQIHVYKVLGWNKEPRAEVKPKHDCLRGWEEGHSASDLPPCRWLLLFAHSVNYYQKPVYLGCGPTLLRILRPIIKGDLHYEHWSPSKKARAAVSPEKTHLRLWL